MPMLFLALLTPVCLSVLLFDLFKRRIHLAQLILLFSLALAKLWLVEGTITHMLWNAGWIVFQAVLLGLFVVLTKRRSLRTFIGVGDGLFLLAVTPIFDTPAFIIYYLSGLIISLLGGMVMNQFSSGQPSTVPLAGFMAAWLLPFYAIHEFTTVISDLAQTLVFLPA